MLLWWSQPVPWLDEVFNTVWCNVADSGVAGGGITGGGHGFGWLRPDKARKG